MKKIYSLYLVILFLISNINAQSVEEVKVTGSPTNTAGLFAYNNKLYFGGQQVLGQTVLWSSDVTAAGTNPLKTGTLGFIFGAVALGNAAVFNNKIFFGATTIPDGKQLWTTDGTDAGTIQF